MDIPSTVSNSVDKIENITADRYRATPNNYELVIRWHILSRFPKIDEKIRLLLESSILERREYLLSLRSRRPAHSGISERAEEDEPSDVESLASVPLPPWNDYQYPPPPEVDDGVEMRRCDWCLDDVKVSNLKDSAWWRQHFLADLRPYVCLAGCEPPFMLFSRFYEWQEHMDFFHGEDWIARLQKLDEWHCPITPCPSGQQIFRTPRELQAHFHLMHDRYVALSRIILMPKKSAELSPNDPSICPFCHQHILIEESALSKGHADGDITHRDGSKWFVNSDTLQRQEGAISDEFTNDTPSSIPWKDPALEYLETEMLIKHIASDLKTLAFISLRGIGSENIRAGSAGGVDHRKGWDDVLRGDNDADMSLSVHAPASLKSGIKTLSNGTMSVRPGSSPGTNASSMRDNTDYVYWSGHPEFELPARGTQNDRYGVDPPVIVGDLRATAALRSGGLSTTRTKYSTSTTLISSYMRSKINDALVDSAFDTGRRFLPEGSLNRLVTSENIRASIACLGSSSENTQSLVDFIRYKARKMFIIIVYIDIINVGEALESLQKMGGNFSPPWFTPDNKEMVLDARTILPLVSVGQDARLGYFSEVYEVELHRDHHRRIMPTQDGDNLRVALKELRMDARDGELRSVFEREIKSLKALREFQHEHLVTMIASIARGEKRYLIFPWADGSDLRAFWMKNNFWPLTPHIVQEAVKQLHGLATALHRLHESKWRHGDIKPENILRFKNMSTLGTLKLGDLGLAKTHRTDTALRSVATDTRLGTMRYEPPETVTSSKLPRSRKYDIWSMGCVILEFVMWLLYGTQGLEVFSRTLSKDRTFEEAFYSTSTGVDGKLQGEVHPVVRFWLDELSRHPDWPLNSVVADLVKLVKNHLLVVKTSRESPTLEQLDPAQRITPPITMATESESDLSNVRADAMILECQLSLIYDRCLREPEYLFPEGAKSSLYGNAIPNYQNPSSMLRPPPFRKDLKPSALRAPVLGGPKQLSQVSRADVNLVDMEDYGARQVNGFEDTWKYTTDNDFAHQFFTSFNIDPLPIPGSSSGHTCDHCKEIDFCSPNLSVDYTREYLEENARAGQCQLCSLLHDVLSRNSMNKLDSHAIQLQRHGSIIKLRDTNLSIFSIVADPSNLMASPTPRRIPADIQIGLPNLQDFNSATPHRLITQWLADCEAKHHCTSKYKVNPYVPKRLLFVENDGTLMVRLVEATTIANNPGSYITLSYVQGRHGNRLRLLKSTYAELRHGVPAAQLERSFQDAALVALQIGIPYLWIDALCLIQDDNEVISEAINIDQVFQSSYCTIALTSAVSVEDGFLKPRRQRRAIKMERGNGGIYYVCEPIDDFERDVEESPLSSRGWTYQERILSRRTIFFTNTQIYWECGDGIRCETLTKMTNWRSRILGDPDFPTLSLKTLGPIETYEQLYERYSLLRFSASSDRSLAIQPLEKRVLQGLKSEGGYGVVARFLGHSLLWRRGTRQSLERIEFTAERNIPSWSWQAYMGGINYLSMPPDTIDWKKIYCRFGNSGVGGGASNKPSEEIGELVAEAWDFHVQVLLADMSRNLTVVWDRGDHGKRKDLKCITVASINVDTNRTGSRAANYLLILAPRPDGKSFERLGVGHMDGEEPATSTKVIVKVR